MNIRSGIENLGFVPLASPSTQATNAYAATKKIDNAATHETATEDQATLSNAASQVAQSAAGSDVRLDKVATIQTALQSGTYDIPALDVAKKIITSMLPTE